MQPDLVREEKLLYSYHPNNCLIIGMLVLVAWNGGIINLKITTHAHRQSRTRFSTHSSSAN